MSWFKVDDGFLTHPKVYGIKSGPLALWLRAGCWCAGELTDGCIPARALRGLDAKPAHVKELVDRGLWDPAGDGFQFHDWLDYQPSREQVLKTRNETLQRVRKHRNAVTNAVVTPAPVPVPVPEPKELESVRARTRESSARFERPPVGEAPPNTPPSTPAAPSWLVAWPIVERTTDKAGMLGHPERHREWLQQLAAAAEREQACRLASSFPEAVERLVRAWMADPYVIKNDADIGNIGVWLRRRKPPTQKPQVPVRLRDRMLSDAELLALSDHDEGDLDLSQKQRRWELQARRDAAESRMLRAVVGGAS
jgi:hypothetical protein